MVSCIICKQTKKHAYICVNGVSVCTEDALEILAVVNRIGLDHMGQKLEFHHKEVVGGNTGG